MSEDKPKPPPRYVEVQKGYVPGPGRPLSEGYLPIAPGKVQGGYIGPTGSLPPAPTGGSGVAAAPPPPPATTDKK
jgi:hypothetical protein